MKKPILIIIIVLIIAVAGAAAWITQKEAPAPVLDPPATKDDLIRVDTPRPNQTIQSPLVITGEARGNWFFEASFPVVLVNWDGLIIAQGIATAKSDPSTGLGVNWMTTEYVPFEATLTFTIDKNTYSNRGALILRKDNPSGLPEHDNALEIPIIFDGIATPIACTQEAKQCPDGSYVGRTGPNCEFSACPNNVAPYDSGVSGKVLLGPTCPVMRDPPASQCADKPYATTVQVIAVGSSKSSPFATVESDQEGNYKIMLPPGEYGLQAVGKMPFPSCGTKNITIKPDTMVEINLSCDTGIR
ncbi:MAG: Gmad2 immunoglobulin-like domain-containing protein [Candidatus Azambacteria bacterium]|nr:Gmad2 immunoglobulin-like domain-containing protein [Candidatus Azambacteria bacterium]